MERGIEHAKKEAKDQVPGDRVKDAFAMARELRWRVRLANGYTSDDDSRNRRKGDPVATTNATHGNVAGKKRKRVEEDMDGRGSSGTFMHYKPRPWDVVVARPTQMEQKTLKVSRPSISRTDWADEWVEWQDFNETADAPETVMKQRRDVIVKVRRTGQGIERQRVERVLENWTWDDRGHSPAPEIPHPTLTNGHLAKSESTDIPDIDMDNAVATG